MPTEQAMRGEKAVVEYVKLYMTGLIPDGYPTIAELIDEATGLPKLVRFASMMVEKGKYREQLAADILGELAAEALIPGKESNDRQERS